ncbi:MAG: RluA family pseudouridine synthase [Flavobacteriaceae bacterium]|nr:RluA family pseudouridine synthase [Flavobacteriaceae bacterium]
MQPQILFEDNHLLVINKPPGVLAQGDNTKDRSVLDIVKNIIKIRDEKPGKVYLGLVHRLDRPTSGVMVLAKTSKALSRLNKQFAEKTTSKTYWAIVSGTAADTPTRLSHFLIRKQAQNKSYAHRKEVPNSKFSELIYTKKRDLDRYTLLEIELLTGRHHQIRAQLSAEGLIIKGDLKYGAKRPNKDGSIHLHARKLTIIHPTLKEPISFTAPPPKDAVWNAVVD